MNEKFDIRKHIKIKKPSVGEWILIPTNGIYKVIEVLSEKEYIQNLKNIGYNICYYTDEEIDDLTNDDIMVIINRDYSPEVFFNNESYPIVIDEEGIIFIKKYIDDDILMNLYDYVDAKYCNIFHFRYKTKCEGFLDLINDYINGFGTNDLSKALRKNRYKVLFVDNKGFRYIKLTNNDIWKCQRIKTVNTRRCNFSKKNKKENFLMHRKHTYKFIKKIEQNDI